MAAATNGGYTNVRRSALDYETSGDTVDWSYYATRGFANTLELVGSISGCPQALPNYLNCTMADYTGSPPAAASATQKARFTGFPVRNALYLSLIYASLSDGHSVIKGSAVPGATLKITKDFNLYTAPVQIGNTIGGPSTPPRAISTHLETSMVVPANGQFTWDVNPSIRPTPAFEADGEHAGPRGYITESWSITCTAPNGTLLETNRVTVDKGQTANISLCTQGGAGGMVPATLSLTLGTPASFGAFTPGLAKDYPRARPPTSSRPPATRPCPSPTRAPRRPATSSTVRSRCRRRCRRRPTPARSAVPGSASPLDAAHLQRPDQQRLGGAELQAADRVHDALRTGAYAKTLTFTLSTTNP